MDRIPLLVVAALLAASATACDRYGSGADEREKAAEAQREADRVAAEARREAAEKSADIRKDVAEKTTDIRKDYEQTVAEGAEKTAEARSKANAEAAEAQAKANEKIREANAEIKATDLELRKWGQQKLDALDNKIDEAKVKAQTAKPAVLADFKAGITDVEAKRNVLATEIGSATASDAASVDKVKDGLDKRIDSLKARVDRLSKQL